MNQINQRERRENAKIYHREHRGTEGEIEEKKKTKENAEKKVLIRLCEGAKATSLSLRGLRQTKPAAISNNNNKFTIRDTSGIETGTGVGLISETSPMFGFSDVCWTNVSGFLLFLSRSSWVFF
ncbi:MAG: hypothetical protein ABH869_04525 [Candidatus Omnitrophota bacterium]